ncbi:hypothetical protein [Nocardioides abyssi]|uniref:Lipoprotein n=1 Tax=Nocardioides abyssi TaxID=3058370 RepID=A0ABT8EXR8_9ACTN|nr:hypothetical protein [Nocardioides abyssi]MDN4162935.1 hypothetical protein [Nocardioides abyssi]
MKKMIAALAVMAMFATGCSNGSADNTRTAEVSTSTAAPVQYDESAIVKHIGAVESDFGSWFITTDNLVECEIAVILTTEVEVSTYADAGDNVATNPDGTAGVKIVAPEGATCNEELTKRLSTFPDGEPYSSGPVEGEDGDAGMVPPTPEAEIETQAQTYTNSFLTGDGQAAYAVFSKRCQGEVDRNYFIGITLAAKSQYGKAAPFESFKADVKGNKATVSYTFADYPELNQTDEAWVNENGLWLLDDCPAV